MLSWKKKITLLVKKQRVHESIFQTPAMWQFLDPVIFLSSINPHNGKGLENFPPMHEVGALEDDDEGESPQKWA